MAFCTTCGAQIPEGVTACPACSRSAAPGTVAVQPVAGGLTDNVAGMLAYFTFIPAIVFLVLEPFNKKPFIRFHSFQSIFFAVAVIAIQIALSIVGMVPFLFFITFPLHLLVWLGSMAIWVVLILKAYQGQMFKLPIIGDMAANQAGV
jgi:uncharacterized membrane protein